MIQCDFFKTLYSIEMLKMLSKRSVRFIILDRPKTIHHFSRMRHNICWDIKIVLYRRNIIPSGLNNALEVYFASWSFSVFSESCRKLCWTADRTSLMESERRKDLFFRSDLRTRNRYRSHKFRSGENWLCFSSVSREAPAGRIRTPALFVCVGPSIVHLS